MTVNWWVSTGFWQGFFFCFSSFRFVTSASAAPATWKLTCAFIQGRSPTTANSVLLSSPSLSTLSCTSACTPASVHTNAPTAIATTSTCVACDFTWRAIVWLQAPALEAQPFQARLPWRKCTAPMRRLSALTSVNTLSDWSSCREGWRWKPCWRSRFWGCYGGRVTLSPQTSIPTTRVKPLSFGLQVMVRTSPQTRRRSSRCGTAVPSPHFLPT